MSSSTASTTASRFRSRRWRRPSAAFTYGTLLSVSRTDNDSSVSDAERVAPRSERLVAVLARHEHLALVGERGEGGGDLTAGVGRVDDGVDEASFGGDVRV